MKRIQVMGSMFDLKVSPMGDPMIEIRGWTDEYFSLPDEGVFTPEGSILAMTPIFENTGSLACLTSVPEIKDLARRKLNDLQWNNNFDSLPVLVMPDPRNKNMAVPFVTALYGWDARTGKELVAFGTAAPIRHQFKKKDPIFETKWFVSKKVAKFAYREASKTLASRRELLSLLEEDRIERICKSAERYWRMIRKLETKKGWGGVETHLRGEVSDLNILYPPREEEKALEYAKKAKAILAKTKAELACPPKTS